MSYPWRTVSKNKMMHNLLDYNAVSSVENLRLIYYLLYFERER